MPETSQAQRLSKSEAPSVWHQALQRENSGDPDATRIWEKPRLVVDNAQPSREDETMRGSRDVGQEKEKLGPAVEGHSIASAKHESNEDSFYAGNGSVCVADGMGSHGGGDYASFLTTESFRSEIEQRGITVNSSREEVEGALLAAMASANEAIDNSRKEETARVEKEVALEEAQIKAEYQDKKNRQHTTEIQYFRLIDKLRNRLVGSSDPVSQRRLEKFTRAWGEAKANLPQMTEIDQITLERKIGQASAEIRAENKMRGMKTTAVMAHEYRGSNGERRILGAYVGDSRGDLIRDGQIRELTTEKDTFIRSLTGYVNKERVVAGKPPIPEVNEDDPEAALPPEVLQWLYVGDRLKMEPLKSMLDGKSPERVKDLSAGATKALEGGATVEKNDGTVHMDYNVQPHFFDEEIRDGDVYLFSTDGRDNLSQAQVLEIVSNTPDTEELPRKIAEAAYKIAQDGSDPRSQDDDITVVTLHSLPEVELEEVKADAA
ncbi:MAG: hypothetical protein ABII72_03485 [Parcubacteria group bacterium]